MHRLGGPVAAGRRSHCSPTRGARVVIVTPRRRACGDAPRAWTTCVPARRAAGPRASARRAARAVRDRHAAVRGRATPQQRAVTQGLVDELLLSLSPKLAGGDDEPVTLRCGSSQAPELQPPWRSSCSARPRASRICSCATALSAGAASPARARLARDDAQQLAGQVAPSAAFSAGSRRCARPPRRRQAPRA